MAFPVPSAKQVPHTFEHLGRTFSDPYTWMQKKDDPEVLAYLEAENAYAKQVLANTTDLQETLYQEMKGRLAEDDSSVPEPRGEHFYYWRMEAGKQYRIFCRKTGSLDAPEQIHLDENQLAVGHEYCRVGLLRPSPDHTLLAYCVDTKGSRENDVYIIDLQTGVVLSGPLPAAAYSLAWASDNRTLFYTRFDQSHRAYQLIRHTLGSKPDSDVVVYQETDEMFDVEVQRTRSGKYFLMILGSHTTTEVHMLPTDQPLGAFKMIAPRRSWHEYFVEHQGDQFWIMSNAQAVNFRLMSAPVSAPEEANWQEVLPHRPATLIEQVAAFQGKLVVLEREGGLRRVRVSDPDGVSNVRYALPPEPAYDLFLDANPEYANRSIRINYSSLVTPPSVVDYDMFTSEWVVKKVQPVPSGYDPTQYTSERLTATAPDGVQVPVSLVYRKGLQRKGSAPLLLYGYGSYGYSTDAFFSSSRLSLLDRGFVYAIAHIRGGQEMGRAWYENGRLLHKKNTFTDFIACAEMLVAEKYTSPDKLAIQGGSAGGLLVSAVTNLRPDLFKAVVAQVPFTNVITAMLTPDLPLTVTEYEEWGNPSNPVEFEYMYSYSPYDKVEAKAYPHIYAKAGLHDLQVPYWDPAKWVAKLRAMKTDDNRLLLVTNMGAGHGGASGRYDALRELAQIYAFLLDTLPVPKLNESF